MIINFYFLYSDTLTCVFTKNNTKKIGDIDACVSKINGDEMLYWRTLLFYFKTLVFYKTITKQVIINIMTINIKYINQFKPLVRR